MATLISTYAVYGYRLGALEDQVKQNRIDIAAQASDNTTTAVSLAKIQVDIEYIKVQLAKLVP